MATATALSFSGGGGSTPLLRGHAALASGRCCAFPRWRWRPPRLSASRADDSSPAPFEMTVEGALKLLGVAEGASFDEILRAKNAVLASCKDDQDAVAQVEAAYDMLLMQSLSQRRAGKVANNSIRYADVKPVKTAGAGTVPKWMQATMKNAPITFETPSSNSLGIQSCVYGALMVFTYASGSSTSLPSAYTSPDMPGFILATGFGASLYFLAKKNMNLGKAALITVGGLAAGATVGSTVENFLQGNAYFPLKMKAAVYSKQYMGISVPYKDHLYPVLSSSITIFLKEACMDLRMWNVNSWINTLESEMYRFRVGEILAIGKPLYMNFVYSCRCVVFHIKASSSGLLPSENGS